MIRGDETIRDISRSLPRATWVFERYGIDFCCGGQRPLENVCRESKLPLDEVIAALEAEASAATEAAPAGASLKDTIVFIVDTHHRYTRDALERAMRLSEKVARVHGARHPELVEMRRIVVALDADLLPHLLKEERVLFPYVASLEGDSAWAPPAFGRAENPVRMMEGEHDAVGELLRSLRAVTSGYAPPEDACGSYRALYEVLSDLETDLHRHIHLENNVVFPRALELEAAKRLRA